MRSTEDFHLIQGQERISGRSKHKRFIGSSATTKYSISQRLLSIDGLQEVSQTSHTTVLIDTSKLVEVTMSLSTTRAHSPREHASSLLKTFRPR